MEAAAARRAGKRQQAGGARRRARVEPELQLTLDIPRCGRRLG
jgi:hypothetical protein